MKEKERQRQAGNIKRTSGIAKIFDSFEQQKQVKNSTAAKLSNYLFVEDGMEQDEWETLVLYFETEEKLRTHITSNWEKQHFMMDLFNFIDEGSHSESEILQERLVLICNIISEMLPESKGRSWFWKFRHVLYKFEEYFSTVTRSIEILAKIQHYYIVMKDFFHAESLLIQLDSSFNINLAKIVISFVRR